MTPATSDILAFKRVVATGVAARTALAVAFVAGLFLMKFKMGGELLGTGLVAGAIVAYLVLSFRAMRVSREAESATDHLARGELDDAERVLKGAIRAFTIYPAPRVVELYHLAVLRQGQGRHAEAAEFAQAVLDRRHPELIGAGAEMIALESKLELGDLAGAYGALSRLFGRRLGLSEQVRVLGSRSRYEMKTGAWEHLLWGLPEKLRLAEMMSSSGYANVHAWWAAAARKLGREELGRWLLRRSVAVGGEDGPAAKVTELSDWLAEEIGSPGDGQMKVPGGGPSWGDASGNVAASGKV